MSALVCPVCMLRSVYKSGSTKRVGVRLVANSRCSDINQFKKKNAVNRLITLHALDTGSYWWHYCAFIIHQSFSGLQYLGQGE